MNPKVLHLAVIRAGRTAWDEAGRLSGSTDLPLSPEGEAEAQRVAELLAKHRVVSLICGPDEASRQTAAILAAEAGCKSKVVKDLAEPDMGLWEGVLHADLEERCPTIFRQWKDDPPSVSAPEGERVGEAAERIGEALRRAIARYGERAAEKSKGEDARPPLIAVVTRPIAFGLLRCRLRGLPSRDLHAPAPGIEAGVGVDVIELRQSELARLQEPSRATA